MSVLNSILKNRISPPNSPELSEIEIEHQRNTISAIALQAARAAQAAQLAQLTPSPQVSQTPKVLQVIQEVEPVAVREETRRSPQSPRKQQSPQTSKSPQIQRSSSALSQQASRSPQNAKSPRSPNSPNADEVVNRVVHDLYELNHNALKLASAYSQIETAILQARSPIDIDESEVLTVNGETGIWANKRESENWKGGEVAYKDYPINADSNPDIIRKKLEQRLRYEQEVAVRYLRPPTPPPPGEILIRKEKGILPPSAPPLVIRQVPPRPETPPPLIIREAPPSKAVPDRKVITLPAQKLPPPPRKVIIERLPPLPSKPQPILIERWLPYSKQKRRVIYVDEPDPVVQKEKNVIVQWEAPEVEIKKDFRNLGVVRANPDEYASRYAESLRTTFQLPEFVREIRPPTGIELASESVSPSYELEGDLHALKLINLDAEGLSEYKRYLRGSSTVNAVSPANELLNSRLSASINELFGTVDRDADGLISRNETESLLLRLNSRLGRAYGENEANAFFRSLDIDRDGFVSLEEFKRGFLKLH